jgi:DNA-binding LacI/PurR family transcriptional regulator
VERLAAEAARAAADLAGGHEVPGGELLFAPELVVRGTTAAPFRHEPGN